MRSHILYYIISSRDSQIRDSRTESISSSIQGDNDDDTRLLSDTIRGLSTHLISTGYPVLSACSYLSNNMIDVSYYHFSTSILTHLIVYYSD